MTTGDQGAGHETGRDQRQFILTLERLLAIEAATVPEALNQASDLVVEALGADKIDAFLYDAGAAALVAVGVSDTPMGRRQRELGLDYLSLAGGGHHVAVFETGQPYHAGHADQDPHELVGFVRDLGARSVMTVPLEAEGRRRGVVGAMSARPEAFGPDDLTFLQAVAHWLGLLLRRVAADEARQAAEVARRVAEEVAHVAHTRVAELEAAYEAITDGLVTCDEAGRIVHANRAFRALVRTDLHPSFDALSPLERAALLDIRDSDGLPLPADRLPMSRLLRGEELTGTQTMIIEFRALDGRLVQAEVSGAAERDAGGRVTRIVAIYRDVTERRALEQARDEFLSSAAHDLKTPLTSIRGYAQLLQRRLDRLDVPQVTNLTEPVSGIEASTTRMLRMLDDLVDVMRTQMGSAVRLRRQPTDLVALVRAMVMQQEALATHRFVMEAAVPALVGVVDPVRMERVVSNLLSNAVKYSAEGSTITVRIARAEAPEGPEAVVVVQDQGIGIPAADLPHIFERFQRARNVVGRIAGTGVGLSGARQIVEGHGGHIDVQSQEEVGTTVTIRLPLHGDGEVPRSTDNGRSATAEQPREVQRESREQSGRC